MFEQPETALLCFQRRARHIGIGKRRSSRHDARDPRLAAAVEKEMLDRVAERHLGGERAELRFVLGKTVHHARGADRPGRRHTDERGRGCTDAVDGARARRCFFDKDAGAQILRHGNPSCGCHWAAHHGAG
jgi:hypothetical protein